MKKSLCSALRQGFGWQVILFTLCFALPARGYIDVGMYPFADVCRPEIDRYCADIDYDLGDCMLKNYDYLTDDCGAAVFFFGGERFGWPDPYLRERWNDMSIEERHKFLKENQAELDHMLGRAHTNGESEYMRTSHAEGGRSSNNYEDTRSREAASDMTHEFSGHDFSHEGVGAHGMGGGMGMFHGGLSGEMRR